MKVDQDSFRCLAEMIEKVLLKTSLNDAWSGQIRKKVKSTKNFILFRCYNQKFEFFILSLSIEYLIKDKDDIYLVQKLMNVFKRLFKEDLLLP